MPEMKFLREPTKKPGGSGSSPFASKDAMESRIGELRIAETRGEKTACIWRAMDERGRGWFSQGKIPDYPRSGIAASSKNQGAKYAIWIMSELGLDGIIRFANRGGDAKKAMEAIEKFASEYKDAGTAAKYYVLESYVIAAMALAHARFAAMKEHGFADRTFKAANEVRSKEMDPYWVHITAETKKEIPEGFFASPALPSPIAEIPQKSAETFAQV